jgi:ABC-type polysaccharide/polyol phosphate export permease
MRDFKTVLRLAVNDFKARYAGLSLGAIWALLQPAVTIAVYYFVFQVGFKSVPVANVPYLPWLVAGIVPWFFFSEGWSGATGVLFEYSYLVKKLVFNVSILPTVKVLAAFFTHCVFTALAIVVALLFGFGSTALLQLPYYALCAFAFSLAVGYITAALAPFARDVTQIVGICLQLGFWITPIAWSYTMMGEPLQRILKLNPMLYIVEGFRDSLITGTWFIYKPMLTIWFWIVTGALFAVGMLLFRRVRPHFPDVI